MISGLLKKVFGSRNERLLRQYSHSVRAINALERRGIIRRDGDGLTVVAPHRLEEMIL